MLDQTTLQNWLDSDFTNAHDAFAALDPTSEQLPAAVDRSDALNFAAALLGLVSPMMMKMDLEEGTGRTSSEGDIWSTDGESAIANVVAYGTKQDLPLHGRAAGIQWLTSQFQLSDSHPMSDQGGNRTTLRVYDQDAVWCVSVDIGYAQLRFAAATDAHAERIRELAEQHFQHASRSFAEQD